MNIQRFITHTVIITAMLSSLWACSEGDKTNEQSTQNTAEETSSSTQDDGISDGVSDRLEREQQSEDSDEETEATEDTQKGLYVYYDGIATFTDCSSGNSYPVAQEEIAAELEQTYLTLQSTPRQKILIEVKGEYSERTSPESDEDIEMLIATELLSVIHKNSCQ